jgi:putative SbcD/Mre11-related phosphoesterase
MDNFRVETVFNKLTQKLICETLTKIQLVFPHPAILLKEKSCRALVVSDLHIGWEKLLSQKGIHIPSQTPKLKRQLLNLIEETKPKYLILLGDIKDAITNVSTQEWKEIPEFFETIQQEVSEIQIILGNHDGNLEHLLPEKIKIIPASGTIFGNVGLIHGHAWPAPELLRCKNLITGHVHPTVAIRDPMGLRITKQIFVKVPCNTQQLKKKLPRNNCNKKNTLDYSILQLFILPSFNQFLGGRPVNQTKKKNETFIGPILHAKCVNMNDAETYLLDGTFLGTVRQLKTLS